MKLKNIDDLAEVRRLNISDDMQTHFKAMPSKFSHYGAIARTMKPKKFDVEIEDYQQYDDISVFRRNAIHCISPFAIERVCMSA